MTKTHKKRIYRLAAEHIIEVQEEGNSPFLGCCAALTSAYVDLVPYPDGTSLEPLISFCSEFRAKGPGANNIDYWWPDFSENSQNERCLFLLLCAEAL